MKSAFPLALCPRRLPLLYALGFALGGLSACAHTSTSGVFTTETRVLVANERGETTLLSQGQPLRPGQVFSVELELQQPAHVYIVHRRGGLLGTVYPGVGINDTALGSGTVRLPGHDSFMQMPDLDRRTKLCLLLSAQALPPELRRCPDGRPRRVGQPVVQSYVLIH
jgi:hypothetical protein